jgi:hypothetical protein
MVTYLGGKNQKGAATSDNPVPTEEANGSLVSTLNSRTASTLAAGAVFQGVGEDVSRYGRVGVAITSDNATDGTLTMEVSHDGVTWGGPTRTWADTRFSQPHMWNIVEKYFRIKYTNGTTEATNLSIQVQYSNNADILLGHQLNESLLNETEAIVTRSVLVGQTQGGSYVNVPVGSQGNLQMDLPLTAFGEVAVAEKTAQVQVKFAQGLNTNVVQQLYNKTGSTVTTANGLCTLHTPATAEAFSQIRSKDVIRYGAGQGMDCKFTALFTTGVANSSQWAGAGDDDEMIGFGYNGTSFGILHRKMGELEVRDITFTGGGDAGGGTFTLTLDGTAVTITVPAGSATIADVCALVVAAADDLFNAGRGWEVHTDDSKTVTFISLVAENASGTFSFADVDSGVTAGTFEQATTVLTGVAPTETIIAQANWNIDVMDGTGVSGMTLDPTKLNVFDVDFQYLGGGNLFFAIENPATGKFEPVHMMQHAGAQTTPTFRNPTFHVNMIVKTESGYSGGVLDMSTASFAGFVEGKESHLGVRHEADAEVSTNGTTEVVNLVIHNEETFNSTRNKVEAYFDHLTIINDATRSIKVDVYKDCTHLDSGVTLTQVNGTSVLKAGAGSGTRQGGNKLVTFSVTASESKDINIIHLGIKLRPTETLAFVVTKKTGGSDGNVTIGTSWLERI